jgi:predicted ribonuclease YlaK
MIKFYDTSSLLLKVDTLFEEKELFAISSITLNELENIKTSNSKSEDVKYAARKLLHTLDENSGDYDIEIFKEHMLKPINEADLSVTADAKILACAKAYADRRTEEVCFVTNDLALKTLAKLFFAHIEKVEEDEDDYCGFKEVILNTDEMSDFYSNFNQNHFNLLTNEYLIVKASNGEIVDRLCWTGDSYRHLNYQSFRSKWFGDVRPMKGDVYQAMAADSLANNKITMLKGPAGSGKTYMAMAYLLHKLDRGELDKIIVFCNTVATKNSAKLGFYPGTRDEKLLDSQIGNLLSSKLGDKIEVEKMISEGKLILLPMSDIRGYDTSGMCAGIYISEAQNLDISLMKLALQRIGEDGICIVDGDCKTQVDDINFAGSNNGMKRVSKVFKDHDIYGEIELRKIHRSRIAQIAELM